MNNGTFLKIQRFVSKIRTSTIIVTLFLLGMACGVFIRIGQMSQFNQERILALIFFIWGLAGLVVIMRKELDLAAFRIEGFMAIIIGVLFLLANFAFAFLFLFPK